MKTSKLPLLIAALALPVVSFAGPTYTFAVWNDGNTTPYPGDPNPISYDLDQWFGAGAATEVTTAQLDTPGFLNSFSAVVVSRYDSSFGSYLDATAAANILAYVGAANSPTQGGVAVFTNDLSDNLANSLSGDPYDGNLNQLFKNAAGFAGASGHGYIGEFNGAVMAMTSNSAGVPAIGLLTGNASPVGGYGPLFTYGVGPVGSGNPIDAGVTFPFTDTDDTTFLTQITGELPTNVVDVYTSSPAGEMTEYNDPAVLANGYVISGGHPGVPETSATWLLLGVAVVGLLAFGRRQMRQAT